MHQRSNCNTDPAPSLDSGELNDLGIDGVLVAPAVVDVVVDADFKRVGDFLLVGILNMMTGI